MYDIATGASKADWRAPVPVLETPTLFLDLVRQEFPALLTWWQWLSSNQLCLYVDRSVLILGGEWL